MISIHMCAGVGWGHARVLSHAQRAREPIARAGHDYVALACGGMGRDTQRISHRAHVYEGARSCFFVNATRHSTTPESEEP